MHKKWKDAIFGRPMNNTSDIFILLDKLSAEVSFLREENRALREENALLRLRISELEESSKLNSKNSSKPPSTDIVKQKPAFQKSGKKKQGGQIGHTGKTLQMVENPDKHEYLHAEHCLCGHSLEGVLSQVGEKRQVLNLPKAKFYVTQYNSMCSICPDCGIKNKGTFPSTVTGKISYGASVFGLTSLLSTGYAMPFDKISQLTDDLFGHPINVSTLVSANKVCYQELEPVEQSIKTAVESSAVVHLDETGCQVAGKRNWLHTGCTALLTYLYVSEKRGKEAIGGDKGVIQFLKGWAIHDCYASYFSYDNCAHALCVTHLLRELQAQIDRGSLWATEMHAFLMDTYLKSDKGLGIVMDFEPYSLLFNQICSRADLEEPKPLPKTGKQRGKPKKSKGRNLLERLVKHKDAVLAFAKHKEVPFTNNQAERDIRPCKVKQKVSNSFRTTEGAKIYARIQGFVSTLRKQGINVFEALKDVFNGTFYAQWKTC